MKKIPRWLHVLLLMMVIILQVAAPLAPLVQAAGASPGGIRPLMRTGPVTVKPPPSRNAAPLLHSSPPQKPATSAPSTLPVSGSSSRSYASRTYALSLAAPPVSNPRTTVPEPFPYGNNNYGQFYRDSGNPEDHPGHAFAGSVNLINGNYFLTSGDLFIPAPGLSLQVARSYNSLAAADGITSCFGLGWTHSYNTHIISETGGITLTVVEADGGRYNYTNPQPCGWNPAATCYDPPPGLARFLSYDPSTGTYLLEHKNGVAQTFDIQGRLTGIRERHGLAITLNYSPSPGTYLVVTGPGGETITFFDEDSNGLVETVVDGNGRAVGYTYDAQGRLTGVTYPDGRSATYTYDAQGRMTAHNDPHQPQGVISATITYSGEVVSHVQYPLGSAITITYGTTETQVLDSEAQVSKVEYDPEMGYMITYEGDWFPGLGFWIGKWWWWWPGRWWPIRKRDANGHDIYYEYDELGNVVAVTNTLGYVTRYAYDPLYSNVVSATNAAGYTTLYEYDGQGNLITETKAVGTPYESQIIYTYDSYGNRVSMTDANGQVTRYGYSFTPGDSWVVITNALGYTTTTYYDDFMRPMRTGDAVGGQTKYEYDTSDRLLAVTDPAGNVTRYQYDDHDNLTHLVNAEGLTTTYEYDALDRLVKETNPLGYTTVYTYDTVGRLVARQDADGHVTTYTYGPKGRLLAIYYDGVLDASFEYDPVGNLVRVEKDGVILEYEYNALSQRTAITMSTTAWSTPQVIRYGYDELGHRTAITYPDGTVVHYTYDPLNRVRTIADPSGTYTYTYDAGNRIVRLDYPDGTYITYTYDLLNQLTAQTVYAPGGDPLASYSYKYDALGRLIREDDDGTVSEYQYNAVGLPITVTHSGATFSYQYDALGRRVGILAPVPYGEASPVQFTYDDANRLLQANGVSFSYDKMGARLSDSTGVEYEYDLERRLVRYTRPNPGSQEPTVVSLGYDGLGHLVYKEVNGERVYYLRDGKQVYAELDAQGNVVARYTHGSGVLGMYRDDQHYLFHYDGRGRVRLLTVNGEVVEEYGPDISETGQVYNPVRMVDAWFIPELGLYLIGDGVFYDPVFGVFLCKVWPWIFWPFGPWHPWRPVFRFWPWPWPWPRPWAWPWPRPWPWLWPWPAPWGFPWVWWFFWPWPGQPFWPWWFWWHWWGWWWWGHWWCWFPWWWWFKWWWWPWWHPWWWWPWWWFPWWWWWPCWWWPWWWWGWWFWWWWPWWWWGWWWWCWWWWWPWWWPWWLWWPATVGPPDFGDAPDLPYPSRWARNGARHYIFAYEWLGPGVDAEWDSRQVDLDQWDDGVRIDLANGLVRFQVSTTGAPGRYSIAAPIHVHGWFDWNNDGDWNDPGEFVVNWWGGPGLTDSLGNTWTAGNSRWIAYPIAVPTTLAPEVWARFRLDYAQNIERTYGSAWCGEVEDYHILVPQKVARDKVLAGGSIAYRVGLTSTMGTTVTGLSLVDTLPVSTTLIAASSDLTTTATGVAWTGNVAPGVSREFTYTAQVSSAVAAGTVLHNHVLLANGIFTASQMVSTTVAAPIPWITCTLHGARNVPLNAAITVRFATPMITPTVRFRITPVVSLRVSWTSSVLLAAATDYDTALLTPDPAFTRLTTYTLTVEEGESVTGEIVSPMSFTFSTEGYRLYLPVVLKNYP